MIYKKFNALERFAAISTAVLIFLFYLFFNFNYLSKWIDEKGDCNTYDYYVRLGIPKYLFNPHHIAFDWIGERMYNAVKENGYTGRAMTVLQMRNLLASSLALAILFFLMYKISKKYLLSLLLVGCISFTAAYWMYSQINDTPIIHSTMLAILFLAAIAFPQVKHRLLYSIFLGMFHANLIFFHQSDLIFMIVIFFIYFFADRMLEFGQSELNTSQTFSEMRSLYLNKNKIRLQHYPSISIDNFKAFVIYFVTFCIIVAAAYYYVGIVKIGLTFDKSAAAKLNGIQGATYFFNWLILYTKIDYWGKGFSDMSTLEKVFQGISTYFYQPQKFGGQPLCFDFAHFIAPQHILPNMVGVLFIITLGAALIFARQLYQKYNYIYIATLLFMAIYAIFSMWWEPDYREFWVAPMFSFWFLSFFVLNFFIDKAHTAFRPIMKLAVYTFLLTLGGLLFYFNWIGFVYPNATHQFSKFEIMR